MPQNKILTQICFAGGGLGGRNGVIYARKKGGGRKPVYTDEFAAVLRSIWVFFWYRCGKILAPLIRGQMKHLDKPFRITKEVRKLLLAVSPAAIDRKLKGDKKKGIGEILSDILNKFPAPGILNRDRRSSNQRFAVPFLMARSNQ